MARPVLRATPGRDKMDGMPTFSRHSTPAYVVDRLAGVTLFSGLTEAERAAVVARASLVEMPLGGTIFAEGELTTQLYVLVGGEASLSVAPDGHADPVEVGRVSAGEVLGETGPLLGEPRSATARATKPCHLLRLDAEAFRGLMETMPRFALAVSTELAGRVEMMRREQKGWLAEHGPAALTMERPEITRKGAYMRRYYAAAIRGVLRRHQLVTAGSFPRYDDTFSFTAEERARWLALFGVTNPSLPIPFTYFTTSATLALMQIVADVGVNFRHLLHLRSEMQLNPEGRVLAPGEAYRCSYRLRDVVRLRHDRVALMVQSDIVDDAGRLMMMEQDSFIIKNLPPESVEALASSRTLGRHDAADLVAGGKRGATLAKRRDAGDTGVRASHVHVRPDMGVAYGHVSGDMNVVHTSAAAARLFGYRKPFIQGLCTANYVLRTLTESTGHAPGRLMIAFCRPVNTDSAITIWHTASEFEVCDAKGSLLACGEWDESSPVRARRSMAFSAIPELMGELGDLGGGEGLPLQ